MQPPSSSLEDQLRSLTLRLEALEARLDALEGRRAVSHETAAEPSTAPDAGLAAAPYVEVDVRRWTISLGRSFIVLGGAFLLRALTDAAFWPPTVGVSLGLAYALVWLATGNRAAARADHVRAHFDSGTALIIGFPIIVEATLRFRLFSPDAAAMVLAGFSALVLTSAYGVRLQALAWMGAVGGMVTAIALLVQTGVFAPYSLYFAALGVGALWLGYTRQWKGLRWPTGLLAVAGVLGVTSRALARPPLDSAATAWVAQAVLLVGYFTSIVIRTLVRGRQVIVFEVVQTVLVLLVAVGGALAVSQAVAAGGILLGSALITLGVVAYLVSFAFMPSDSRGALNFYFYSTLALVFVLVGLRTALPGRPQALALTALGVILGVAWSRSGRVTLGGHAAVALMAASMSGGLMTLGEAAFVGGAPAGGLPGTAALTLAVALLVASCRAAEIRTARPTANDIPAIVIALVVAVGGAGVITLAAVAMIEARSGAAISAGALATVRTAVLSAGGVVCAMLDRPGRLSAIGKLSYPLLAITGVKIAIIDLRLSTPATAFVALACYGIALVLVARLRRA